MTTAEIAKTTGASRSGIVRFAKACGFDGYRGLQDELQRQVRATLFPAERIHRGAPGLRSGRDLVEGVLVTGRSSLEKTLRGLDRASYQRAVRQIFRASEVYVMGCMGSTPAAHLLAHYLSHILPTVKLLGVGDASFYRDLRFIGRGDVLVAIAVPPYAQALVEAMTFAKSRGAHILALTDSVLSPAAQVAEVVLTATLGPQPFATSYVGFMGIIEAIVLGVIRQDPARAAEHLRALERAVRDRDVAGKHARARRVARATGRGAEAGGAGVPKGAGVEGEGGTGSGGRGPPTGAGAR